MVRAVRETPEEQIQRCSKLPPIELATMFVNNIQLMKQMMDERNDAVSENIILKEKVKNFQKVINLVKKCM